MTLTGAVDRVRILGVPVDNVSLSETVEAARGWIRDGSGQLHQIVTVNPEFIVAAQRDPDFRAILEQADLSTPDGIGVMLAARLLGRPLRERVTGVDLVHALAATSDTQMRLFLLGGGPGVAEGAAAALRTMYPQCQVAGTWGGSPRPKDAPVILEQLRAARPTILFVAYGAPAQDRWIAHHRAGLASCGIVIAVGVGGTLDYLAGVVPLAPPVVRRLGFEWLYRLIREPWRWRRQLALPRFVFLVLRERLKRLR